MYTDFTSKTYLHKSKLRFYDKGLLLPQHDTVGDHCQLVYSYGDMGAFSPDYMLTGNLIKGSSSSGFGEFEICRNGSDCLYITGVSKDVESLEKYRLSNTLFSSFWEYRGEENKLSFLFQIIRK